MNFFNKSSRNILLVLLILLSPIITIAQNIDLSTLPSRDSVQLTIYNSEDLTLVRETRQISIKKGNNQLQFSWANTKIDPTSVQIEFLSHPISMHLSNTTFPHEKPQMLYWHINSSLEVLATVEITYFTSGISWKADYLGVIEQGVASQSGQTMALDSFVTVTNYSGEDYDNAQIRLVIGKINLVEKINDLVGQAEYKKDQLKQLRRVAVTKRAKSMMSKRSGRYEMAAAPLLAMSEDMVAEKEVKKESLSEYYIYTIEGTESIPDKWSKRLRSGYSEAVKVETVYRYRPREYGDILARVLVFKNDKKSSLGESPLPAGNIQLYQKNQQSSLIYIAGLVMKYTSIGEKVDLNSGADPEIYFELVNSKNWRDNIWMHYKKGKLHRRIGDGHMKVDHNSTVSGWNEHRAYDQRIRNFTDRPIKVEIRRMFSGDVTLKSNLDMKKHDFQTVDIRSTLGVGDKQELQYEVLTKKGRNAKQNQVIIQSL